MLEKEPLDMEEEVYEFFGDSTIVGNFECTPELLIEFAQYMYDKGVEASKVEK